MTPTQCAALFKYRDTTTPMTPDGTQFSDPREATCILFDGMEVARKFCESKVRQYPSMCCEIYDAEGKAMPPLLVVMHPRLLEKDDGSRLWKRKRKIIAFSLIALAFFLFWIDWRDRGVWVVPTFFGINMILAALRFLHFNFWIGENEKDRESRLKAHVKREGGPPQNQG